MCTICLWLTSAVMLILSTRICFKHLFLILLDEEAWLLFFAVFKQSCLLWCISVFTEGLGICSCFDPPQLWMSIRDESRDNNQKQMKKIETCDNKAVPGIAYRLSSSITLRSKFKSPQKWGYDGPPRLDANLFTHIHTADGSDRVGYAATVYVPA